MKTRLVFMLLFVSILIGGCSSKETILQTEQEEFAMHSGCDGNTSTAYISELEGNYYCHSQYFIIDHDINFIFEDGSTHNSKLNKIFDSIEIADGISIDRNNITIRIREIGGLNRILFQADRVMDKQINANKEVCKAYPEYLNQGKLNFYLLIVDKTNHRQLINAHHEDNTILLNTDFPEDLLYLF